ncbi:hypothetical protein HELRODRAFT_163551 [Helobdella robusta]|uniref:Uncharacterized protein n=1 Tax=Helobdella robusta TaxID=6412 RepID=T1EU71_HELRO|nr:hypothetical protein HELRODRAFT_163551 [Helobdella robusta]ESN96484.1 hypothetical protein HELRODRAFT_163551 [Helobdella robusta]
MTEYQSKEPDQEPRYLCDLCMSKMDVRQKYHDPSKYSYLWPMTPKSVKVAKARVFAAEVERREGRHRMRIKVQVQPFKACTESDEWVEVPGSRSRSAKDLPGIKSAFTSDDTRYTTFVDDEDDFEDKAVCPANKPLPPVVADYGHGSESSKMPLPIAPKSAYFYNCNFDFKQGTSYNCFEENSNFSQRAYINPLTANYEYHSAGSLDKNQRMFKCNMDLECDAEAALHISNAITQGLLEYKLQTDNESNELREQFEALKRQNASSFSDNITNPVMSMALKEAQYMARLLPFGDEALFASAMSILDSLNNKLYMLMEKSKEEGDQTIAENSKNHNSLPPDDGVLRFKMRPDQAPKRFKFGL